MAPAASTPRLRSDVATEELPPIPCSHGHDFFGQAGDLRSWESLSREPDDWLEGVL